MLQINNMMITYWFVTVLIYSAILSYVCKKKKHVQTRLRPSSEDIPLNPILHVLPRFGGDLRHKKKFDDRAVLGRLCVLGRRCVFRLRSSVVMEYTDTNTHTHTHTHILTYNDYIVGIPLVLSIVELFPTRPTFTPHKADAINDIIVFYCSSTPTR